MVPGCALAYGPEGHLIAGRAAEPLLCSNAAAVVNRLAPGDDLGEIGLWADRIRSNEAYADAAPWHYMNIDDDASLDAFVHPPEGDVLEAIERFSVVLADESRPDAARTEALRFLVHFIADIHQPLHVGRADDRGGNRITIRFRGEETNLHRFWDTHAIEWADESLGRYTATVAALAADAAASVSTDPVVWAEESLAYRAQVYDFGAEFTQPRRAYLEFAAGLTRERLALAAARLAASLNDMFCE